LLCFVVHRCSQIFQHQPFSSIWSWKQKNQVMVIKQHPIRAGPETKEKQTANSRIANQKQQKNEKSKINH